MYRCVRTRLRNLNDVRKLVRKDGSLRNLFEISREVVSQLGEQHQSPSSHGTFPSAETSNHDVLHEEALQARDWLYQVLTCHDKLLGREHEMRMLRIAVEKERAGQNEDWTEKEQLYMALTDPELADAKDRLKAAFTLVLHFNLAQQLKHVSAKAQVCIDRVERNETMTAQIENIRETIVAKIQNVKIDHFACAIPLSQLTSQPCTEEASCPICQNAYTDLRTFSILDLLADYPVRIKYCGHVVGKACLEQWMTTPKIDEAKYPHRTCPLCRVKIEGVDTPPLPMALCQYLETDWRAMEMLREMEDGWGMEVDECLDAVVACMSEEVAVEELMALVERKKTTSRWAFNKEEKMLRDRLEGLSREKWAWGFRGDGVWRRLRNEWVGSGVVRKE